MLERILTFPGHLVITGDFNFHIDVPSDPLGQCLSDLLDSLHLTQLVQSPTHKLGHTLDLLIIKADSNTVMSATTSYPCLLDHLAVNFTITLPKQPRPTKNIIYRKLKSIVIEDFVADVEASIAKLDQSNLDTLVQDYNNSLRTTLDKHAPPAHKNYH